ncbi:unnamed protein product [Spodoptera littoralis]|uniref:WAP domain-containing protein n=1 Tax=Spodoptera littoralis TaxID=7109 RepID=A0A9P0IK87_SPOLI|nr:unnamed protein product [Spodoptera littoralis]
MYYFFILLVLSLVSISSCDPDKTGSCPPSLPVDICDETCLSEIPCSKPKQLCCPTACGGAICVDAMTHRNKVDEVKPGLCPEKPRGPWICTNMCTSDSDCRRVLKCCPNRCGAFACQKPDAPPSDGGSI